MMDETKNWFLLKHEDGSLYGPIAFEQLKQWAAEAQISPHDKVSTDEKTWSKAPMIPDLAMDFLIEVTPDQYYGPTTIGAVREFMKAGEINGNTTLTNCKDGTQHSVKDIPELMQIEAEEEQQPVRTSIRRNLQQRILELEEALLEERRAREEAEKLVDKLETKLMDLAAKTR